jgi:hypothetical protein
MPSAASSFPLAGSIVYTPITLRVNEETLWGVLSDSAFSAASN